MRIKERERYHSFNYLNMSSD